MFKNTGMNVVIKFIMICGLLLIVADTGARNCNAGTFEKLDGYMDELTKRIPICLGHAEGWMRQVKKSQLVARKFRIIRDNQVAVVIQAAEDDGVITDEEMELIETNDKEFNTSWTILRQSLPQVMREINALQDSITGTNANIDASKDILLRWGKHHSKQRTKFARQVKKQNRSR